jgi:hypothetical protein
MHQIRLTPLRSIVGVAAAAVVLLVVSGTDALSRGNNPNTLSGNSNSSTRAPAAPLGIASEVAAPIACCSDASQPGITATGQASVRGDSQSARDTAIAQAVADATEQARTAARAAGVTLGSVVDLSVSASPYPTPLYGEGPGVRGVSAPGAATAGAASSSSSGVAVACPVSTPCPPTPRPTPESFASVTITWAIQ